MPKISDLDNGVLNPTIQKIVGLLLGATGKTEEALRPIINIQYAT